GTNFLKYANVYPTLIGNFHRGDQISDTIVNKPTHITIDIGEGNTVGDVYGQSKYARGAQNSSTTIDIVSGTVGSIYGDNFDRANAAYGPTTINISGGKITGEIVGTKMGFNANSTNKTVLINVTGGDFSACTTILAAKSTVADANKPTSCTVDARKADAETVARLKAIKQDNVTLLYNQIVSGTVTLGESVAMNFNVDLDGITDASVKVTMNGSTETITEKTDNGNGTYAFTLKLDPSQLADTFTAELMDGETVVSTLEDYSVKAYCDALAAKYSNDAELMALIADLLEYAAAAQTFTGHNTANPANDLAWVASHKTAYSDVATDRLVTGAGDAGASFEAAYLNLYDSVSVRFKVGGTDKENLTAKLFRNGAEVEFETIGSLIEMRSDRIKPTEYDSQFEAVLYRSGAEIQRVRYSVKSYVASYQNASDNALKTLVQRLYQYGVSAKAYQG
ncbi:MAG: hypothetical protein IK088_07030, partial [Lachnospiraceae bacterium]|nr:hypothetical protein [Lachnospiraceae bacterium]